MIMNNYDSESITMVSGYLDKCGYSPSATVWEYDFVDLIARGRDGRLFGVEVKNRSFSHDLYNDIMTDYSKYANGVSAIARGRFANMIVASVYSDDTVCFANITAGNACWCYAPTTTCFDGGRTTEKKMWKMPQQKTVKINR